jgi:hypothetical protein
MIVTVKDNKRMGELWGTSGYGIVLRTVEIADACPQCGGARGEIRGYNGCEDGDYYHVNVWNNACGHVDYYEAVIAEAERLQAERQP